MLIKDKPYLLIDSNSVDRMLSRSGRRQQALFTYINSSDLNFVRSPETVENNLVRQIVQFEKEYSADESLHSIKIVGEKSSSEQFFGYKTEQMEEIGRLIYNKKELNNEEWNSIELVFIHACLNGHSGLNILVTENEVLLRNRLWFECHFPGGTLNIMTLEEAAEIVDLFLKTRGRYCVSCNYLLNKGYWYWLSFRTKVPFYNVGDPILDAFAQRFVFLLMSDDEIGFQYFSGVNNDTMDNAVYHFNYFILLTSGIFDSLAIRTFNQYKLVFKDSNNPSRISLCSENGKQFLKALREKHEVLRDHIHDYVDFIKVIYLLRDTVVHREGLKQARFESRERDRNWQVNFIRVPNELVHHLRQCGDKREDYEPWTRFGVYRLHDTVYLEPYKFVKSSTLALSDFCSKYLQLLGFNNFVEEMERNKPEDDFVRTMKAFRESNVGL